MGLFSAARPAPRFAAQAIDEVFSVTGQIEVADLPAISEAGYKAIVCARPDGESVDQPSFDTIARAAEAQGLLIVHVPVSGPLTQSAFLRFADAMEQLPRPILGYCRSGARAASLYATWKANSPQA